MKPVWHPGELLNTSSAYWRGCTLQAAVRLQIFSVIGNDSMSGLEIAQAIDSDNSATELLLDALSGMGLLIKEDNRYQNCHEALQFLVRTSPHYMGHILLHHHHLLDGWAQLDQRIISGQPVVKRSYGEEVERESFIMGMFNLAMQIAPEIASQIDLSGRKRLLDLGGGPGTYAINFLKNNPALTAVIFDRPTTRQFALETAERFDLTDRIEFLSGDFTVDPLGGGPYDVAWLSHILHSNSPAQCLKLVKKCVGTMNKGGLIFIHDFILDNTKDGPEFPALFSLNMLLANNDGRSYSEEEISDMLLQAGVTDVQRHPFQAKNDSSILYGMVA